MKNSRLLRCAFIASLLFGTVTLPAVTLLSILPAEAQSRSGFTPPADDGAPEITRGGATRAKSEEKVRWTPNPERGSANSTLSGGRR